MEPNKTALERAFEIAATGVPTSITDIRHQLRTEGYDIRQIEGRSLTEQLRQIYKDANAEAKGT